MWEMRAEVEERGGCGKDSAMKPELFSVQADWSKESKTQDTVSWRSVLITQARINIYIKHIFMKKYS